MVTDREVTLSGGMVISYLDAGAPDGDVVFYFHGTPSSRMQAAGLVDAAAARFGVRVIAPDRPGCGGSPFVRYRVADYPAIVARFADSLGIGEFGVIGTSGGGRYALSYGSALAERLRRVAVVSSTAPSDFPGVRQTWSNQDRRLYTTAAKAPWILWAWMAKTARDLRRDPGRMLKLLPQMSPADEQAVQRADVRAVIRAMSTEAFRQGGRGAAHDLRLEALPWGVSLESITAPVDVWHAAGLTLEESAAIAADPVARRGIEKVLDGLDQVVQAVRDAGFGTEHHRNPGGLRAQPGPRARRLR
jgi:pimeloyl-ACP methyl ester carboxylesterase